MKAYQELNRIADLFEYKWKKYAEEVGDSTMLTLSFRPIANTIIDTNANKLLAPAKSLALKNAQPGDVSVGGNMYTNAKKVNGRWNVTGIKLDSSVTGFPITNKEGESVTDPAVVNAVSAAVASLVRLLVPAITNELNRIAGNLDTAADTITNHQTNCNSVTFGI